MNEKIWFELVDRKYGEIYLTKYLSLQRTLKKTFTILTLLISISGILGWKYFEDYAWIAFGLISIMQLLTLIENQLIRSEKEVEKISNLRMMYTKYFHKLEENATNQFFELRKTDWEKIEELDCKLDIKKFNRLMNKTDIETNQYLNKYHNYEQTT
jgi:hypothetical protein